MSVPKRKIPMRKDVYNIAIVGLGFGAEFIPIHQAHPNLNLVAVCRRNEEEMNKVADRFGIEKRYVDYDDLLRDRTSFFLSMTVGFLDSDPTLYVVHGREKPVLRGPNSEKPILFHRILVEKPHTGLNYCLIIQLSCFRKRRFVRDPEIDAVHINTPIPDHAPQGDNSIALHCNHFGHFFGDFLRPF